MKEFMHRNNCLMVWLLLTALCTTLVLFLGYHCLAKMVPMVNNVVGAVLCVGITMMVCAIPACLACGSILELHTCLEECDL